MLYSVTFFVSSTTNIIICLELPLILCSLYQYHDWSLLIQVAPQSFVPTRYEWTPRHSNTEQNVFHINVRNHWKLENCSTYCIQISNERPFPFQKPSRSIESRALTTELFVLVFLSTITISCVLVIRDQFIETSQRGQCELFYNKLYMLY